MNEDKPQGSLPQRPKSIFNQMGISGFTVKYIKTASYFTLGAALLCASLAYAEEQRNNTKILKNNSMSITVDKDSGRPKIIQYPGTDSQKTFILTPKDTP